MGGSERAFSGVALLFLPFPLFGAPPGQQERRERQAPPPDRVLQPERSSSNSRNSGRHRLEPRHRRRRATGRRALMAPPPSSRPGVASPQLGPGRQPPPAVALISGALSPDRSRPRTAVGVGTRVAAASDLGGSRSRGVWSRCPRRSGPPRAAWRPARLAKALASPSGNAAFGARREPLVAAEAAVALLTRPGWSWIRRRSGRSCVRRSCRHGGATSTACACVQ